MDNCKKNWSIYRHSTYSCQFSRQQRVRAEFLLRRSMKSRSCLAHSWSECWLWVAGRGLFELQMIPAKIRWRLQGRENSLTTPITPTFLSLQSATDSSQQFVSFPVSHCALWITFPAKVSRPSISGQFQRLRAPTPVNKTSAVSRNSSQSS